MDFERVVRKRRSIRRYNNKPIANSIIEKLFDLARLAPSSMDGQPWHFIVVRDSTAKDELAKIKNKYCPIKKREYSANFLKHAAAVVLVCVEKRLSYDREVENAVLATANIMLGARNKGIGSVYMSAYKLGDTRLSQEIKRILRIPKKIEPITIIPLGYPAENLEPKRLKSLSKRISYETFGKR